MMKNCTSAECPENGGNYERQNKKIFIIIFVFLMVSCTVIYFFQFHYSHNAVLTEHFEKNKALYSDYIDAFDKEQFIDKYVDEETGETRKYEIPDNLKAINVNQITYCNGYVFFEVNDGGPYYGGIYYSPNDSLAQETPIYGNTCEEIYKTEFKEKRKGIFVKGNQNTGTDWYQSEKIRKNWYYYEVHI